MKNIIFLAVFACLFGAAAGFAAGPLTFTTATGEALWLIRDAGAAFGIRRQADTSPRLRITPDGVIQVSKGDDPVSYPLSYGYQQIIQADGVERTTLEVTSKTDGCLTLNSSEAEGRIVVAMCVQDCEIRFFNETAGNTYVFHSIPITGNRCGEPNE